MIRVLVVDDSAYNRVAISRMLANHPELEVTDTAGNGEEAIRKVMRLRPDVVTLDLEMAGMDGFAVLRWLGANMPTPTVVVSSQASDRNVFKALEMGAVDFVAKPTGKASPLLHQMERDLITKVLSAAQARVAPAPVPEPRPALAAAPEARPGAFEVVVIGASTGGPPTLQKIFSSLPRLDIPMVIAQHMPPVFTTLFAERLDRVITGMTVKEAAADGPLEPATIYVTAGGMHAALELRAGRPWLRLVPRKENELYCPSVNVLFSSAARVFRDRAAGVLLTGMGDDGAEGLLEMHQAGAYCIAESMESAVIFGMPAEAARLGAAHAVLPAWQIPSALVQLFHRKP
jgi:two-component system chemotaxis response regulator CheB